MNDLSNLASRGFRTAVALTLVWQAGSASADVKIVSRVNVSGGKGGAAVQMFTTWFKGDVVRTESDRVISLYDSKAQTITTMDKQDKTYRVMSLKTALGSAPGMMARLKFNTTAEMRPTDETATIAGYPARKWLGKATFSVSVAGLSGSTTPTTMEIEQWATEDLSLPLNVSQLANPLIRMGDSMRRVKGMEPLLNAMAQVKGKPLSHRIMVSAAGRDGSMRPPVVTQSEAQSVSTETIDSALFRIPEGFTKVEPRSIPAAPAELRKRTGKPKGAHARP
jgi:hypothetical protein